MDRARLQVVTAALRRARPWCAVAVVVVAAALVVSGRELRLDWFSDELWRAVFVHARDWWPLYTSWDTPTAIGFVYLFKAVDLVSPTGRLALRLWTLAFLTLALVLTWRLLVGILERRPWLDDRHGRIDALTATAAVGVLPLLAGYGLHRVFVPYFLETAAATALVLACLRLGTRRWAFPGLCVLLVVVPAVTIGALFLLPAAVGTAGWWAWSGEARWRRIAVLGASAVAGAGVALASYLFVYQPVQRPSIDGFWRDAVLAGNPRGLGGLLVDLFRGIEAGITSWALPGALDHHEALVTLVVGAALATGLFVLGRRWPPFVAFLVGGQTLVVLASAVAGWPMTAVRVNLPLHHFAYVAITFGVATWVRVAARAVTVASARWEPVRDGPRASSWWSVATVALLLLPLVVVVWPRHQAELPFDAFLRGLSTDLQVVSASPAIDNVVVTYHFSAQWYAREQLLLQQHGDRRFALLAETYEDRRVYDAAWLNQTVASLARPGDRVWCVVAFDIGPEASEQACRLTGRFEPVAVHPGERSTIREFVTL